MAERMMMRLPSFSQLDQAMACEASEVWEPRIRSEHEKAHRGNELHRFLRDAGSLGRDAALANVAEEWRPAAEAIDLDALPEIDPSGYAHEIAIAWDCESGRARELHRGGGRDYSDVGPREFVGTLDVLGLTMDGCGVAALDYKTGRLRKAPARVNWQLKASALAASRLFGRHHAHVALIYLSEDREPWFDRAEFDALDLDEIAADLRDLADRIELGRLTGMPKMVTGSQCKFCEVRLACPATTAMIRRLAYDPVDVKREVNALAPDDITTGWRLWKQAKAIVDEIGDSLVGAARAIGPIDTGNGTVLADRETKTERVIGEVVHRVLAEMLGPEVALRAVELDSSKAAIRRALQPLAAEAGKPLAQVEREVLGAIRAAGGVTVKTSVRFGEWAKEK